MQLDYSLELSQRAEFTFIAVPCLIICNKRKRLMESDEQRDKINKQYNKWLVAFRLNTLIYYTIWGADSTDDGEDKLWIDDHQRIILFEDPAKLIETIISKTMLTFDTQSLVNWALKQKEYSFSDEQEALIDLDSLLEQTRFADFTNLITFDAGFAFELVNFINLFGDYASQTNEDFLLKIWRNPSVHSFWEYMYDTHFWTIPAEELRERQEVLLRNYDTDECRNSLNEMTRTYINRSLIVFSGK